MLTSCPQVFVLLMQMTIAASKSNRKSIIFDPYPSVVDPSNPQELALNPKVCTSHDFNFCQMFKHEFVIFGITKMFICLWPHVIC